MPRRRMATATHREAQDGKEAKAGAWIRLPAVTKGKRSDSPQKPETRARKPPAFTYCFHQLLARLKSLRTYAIKPALLRPGKDAETGAPGHARLCCESNPYFTAPLPQFREKEGSVALLLLP